MYKLLEKINKIIASSLVALIVFTLVPTNVLAADTPYFKVQSKYVRGNNSSDLAAYIMVPISTTEVNFVVNGDETNVIQGIRNDNVTSNGMVEYRLYTPLRPGKHIVTARYIDGNVNTVFGNAIVYSLDDPWAEWVYANDNYKYFRSSDNPLRLKIDDEYEQFDFVNFEISGLTYKVYRKDCDLRAAGSYVLCDVDKAENWQGLPAGEYRTYSSTFRPYPLVAQVRVTTYTKANNRFNPSDFDETQAGTKSRIFYIDNEKPNVSGLIVSNPKSYELFSDSLKVSVQVSDNYGVRDVEFFVTEKRGDGVCDGNGTRLVSSTTTTGNLSRYEAILNTSELNGEYCVNAVAEDLASGHSQILKQKVLIDNISPIVDLDSPTSTILKGTVDIIGSVTDSNPLRYFFVIEDSEKKQLSLKPYKTGTIYDALSFEDKLLAKWDTSKTPDGSYTIKLEARDSAGNKEAISSKFIFVVVDNTAPNTPQNGKPNDSYTVSNDFYFEWDFSIDKSAVKYEFQSSMNPNQNAGVLTTSVWNSVLQGNAEQRDLNLPRIHSVGAPDGVWYWQVRAIDAAGNTSAWSQVWNVTIDTMSPEIKFNGSDKITVEKGTEFTDPGVIITDNISQNLQPTIIGEVNVDQVGLYLIKYFTNDQAGNKSKEITRVVEVVDTTAPAQVSGFTAIAGNGQITLTWSNPNDTDFKGVNVYRSLVENQFTDDKILAGSKLETFVDTNVSNGTKYYYLIRTLDTFDNESDVSVFANSTPVAPVNDLLAPLNLQPGQRQVTQRVDSNQEESSTASDTPEVLGASSDNSSQEVMGEESTEKVNIFTKNVLGLKLWNWYLLVALFLIGYITKRRFFQKK